MYVQTSYHNNRRKINGKLVNKKTYKNQRAREREIKLPACLTQSVTIQWNLYTCRRSPPLFIYIYFLYSRMLS